MSSIFTQVHNACRLWQHGKLVNAVATSTQSAHFLKEKDGHFILHLNFSMRVD